MIRQLVLTLAATLCLPAVGAPATSADTVYRRTQADGSVILTNVPDSEGYQVLVTGSVAPSGLAADAAYARAGVGLPTQDAVTAAALVADPEPRPEMAGQHSADTPPSIEARSGQFLDPELAPTAASAQASQAQEEIEAAGGIQARLRNLYQASMSAFQSRGAAPDRRR